MRAFVRLGDGETPGVVDIESCYNDHWSFDYVLAPIIAEGLCNMMGRWTAYHSNHLVYEDGGNLPDDSPEWELAQQRGDAKLAEMAMIFACYDEYSGWLDEEKDAHIRWALEEFFTNFQRFWE